MIDERVDLKWYEDITPPVTSVLENLCMYNHISCMNLPIIQQVVECKWSRLGRPTLMYSARIALSIALLLTATLVLRVFTSNLLSKDSFQNLYSLLGALITYRFFMESPTVFCPLLPFFGLNSNLRGISLIDKTLTLVTTAVYTAFFIYCDSYPYMNIGGIEIEFEPEMVTYTLSVAVAFSWVHMLFYFAMVNSLFDSPFALHFWGAYLHMHIFIHIHLYIHIFSIFHIIIFK